MAGGTHGAVHSGHAGFCRTLPRLIHVRRRVLANHSRSNSPDQVVDKYQEVLFGCGDGSHRLAQCDREARLNYKHLTSVYLISGKTAHPCYVISPTPRNTTLRTDLPVSHIA